MLCLFDAILCPADVFCSLFTLIWALLSRFTFVYVFLLQKRKYAHISGWIYWKNYRKSINRYFSNYRQKYLYRFQTSSNYRWFEEIIGKDIDIEKPSKVIKKLSLSKKITYRTPLIMSLHPSGLLIQEGLFRRKVSSRSYRMFRLIQEKEKN